MLLEPRVPSGEHALDQPFDQHSRANCSAVGPLRKSRWSVPCPSCSPSAYAFTARHRNPTLKEGIA